MKNRTLFFILFVFFCTAAYTQAVPNNKKKHFARYVDQRSMLEKALNVVGLTDKDVGRSFALLCGVSKYPHMTNILDRDLPPAAEDVRKLKDYLVDYEFFDEIVVLENEHMTLENLDYFLQTYFPKRLKEFPKSRFLFAYSGHGMTENSNGYLLKNTARSLTDRENSIDLRVLRVYVGNVVSSAHHVLVLLNSCYSGAFLKRQHGKKSAIPRYPGAHAITAGGGGELSWHDPEMGSGSLLYEKLFAALEGIADEDSRGIITAFELANYLKKEIRAFSDQQQNPHFGDLSKNGSRGEFFFLNRSKQIEKKILSPFNPSGMTSMGDKTEKLLKEGISSFNEKNYASAKPLLKQSAEFGNTRAMYYLGLTLLKLSELQFFPGGPIEYDYDVYVMGYDWLLEAYELKDELALAYFKQNPKDLEFARKNPSRRRELRLAEPEPQTIGNTITPPK